MSTGTRPPDAGNRLFGAAIAAIAGIGVPIALVLAATAPDSEFPLAAAIGVSAGWMVFCFGIAYWNYRKVYAPQATHLKVSLASGDTVSRGDEIEVRLEITDPGDAADQVEVGIVCTEYYDVRHGTGNGVSRQRKTADAIAHETWLLADTKERLQSVKVTVPTDAPFSFRGNCVKYNWLVTAREPRKMRGDRRVSVPIKVMP